MINGCREVLNSYIPDVWIYSDLGKKVESPGYGLAIMAERYNNINSEKGSLIIADEIYDENNE